MGKSTGCDPIAQFCAEMHRRGIAPPAELQADGQIHRFRTEGDRSSERAGWYVLHLGNFEGEIPHGAFGDWRTGLSVTWCARQQGTTGPDPIALALARRATQELRSYAESVAAECARRLWDDAPLADPEHPYLIRKSLPPFELRQQGTALLVPMTDLDGTIRNLQRIYPDGAKRFFKDARVVGLCSALGSLVQVNELVISEGWATAATLHLPTTRPVLAAMSAGNLVHVAKEARRRWPSADIVIAGDDDRFTKGNPGRTAAIAAAIATCSRVAFPPFEPSDATGTDFNDFYVARVRRER